MRTRHGVKTLPHPHQNGSRASRIARKRAKWQRAAAYVQRANDRGSARIVAMRAMFTQRVAYAVHAR